MRNGSIYGKVDINRDFPYNTQQSSCMNTVGGRLIYKLFEANLFVSAITFHGGTNVIGYPWGSQNHLESNTVASEAPDHTAFDLLGRSMSEAAGGDITLYSTPSKIRQYVVGDMTSTVYWVNGGFEDWAYGAGFDNASDATVKKCSPTTYTLPTNFMTADISHVKCAIYLIETDNSKVVEPAKLGGRRLINLANGSYAVDLRSIYDTDMYNLCDGHINRNIRAALTMIDMSKPYIVVDSIQRVGTTDTVEVTFRVNGCVDINQASVQLDNSKSFLLVDGYCNQLLTSRPNKPQLTQSIIKFKAQKGQTVNISAKVDGKMQNSVDSKIVEPASLVNQPQTHFARLRLNNTYDYEHNRHYATGGLNLNLTDAISALFASSTSQTPNPAQSPSNGVTLLNCDLFMHTIGNAAF